MQARLFGMLLLGLLLPVLGVPLESGPLLVPVSRDVVANCWQLLQQR